MMYSVVEAILLLICTF